MPNYEFILKRTIPNIRARTFNSKGFVDLQSTQEYNFDNIAIPNHNAVAQSTLGTPVYSNLEIEAGQYTLNDKIITYDAMQINTVLYNVTMTKNIVKTVLAGSNGSIKEYVSDGDYSINISGIIEPNKDTGTYHLTAFENFKKILDRPESIRFTSWYLQAIGIDDVVIEGYDLPQTNGQYTIQLFNIRALSDTPIELVET